MPQTQTLSGTGTWTEEEIRQQPASWIRSLTHIDSIRQQIDAFLAPLLTKKDLRIVLTLSLIHISEPTRRHHVSRMPSSA